MEVQHGRTEKTPLSQKIIQVCIWLLPFALLGVLLLLKQSGHDYETIGKYFGFTGIAVAIIGLFLRFATDGDYGRPLVLGGVMVTSGTNLILGAKQTTEPVQTVSFSEWTRSVALSLGTVEQVRGFGIALAVITGALVLYFAVRFVLSIIWEDWYGKRVYLTNTVALGLPLGFMIYVLSLFPA